MENKSFSVESKQMDEEIDAYNIILAINRNKDRIAVMTAIGFLVSLAYVLPKKRVWQGGFQIVLEQKSTAANDLRSVAQKFWQRNSSNSIDTEIAILSSPSVLMETFEYVNSLKSTSSKNESSLRFTDWTKNNLVINRKPKTTILNVKYNDTDKDLIIPVLDRVSKTYQDFSGRKRRRSLELGLDHITSQLEIAKNERTKIIKDAKDHANEHDLILFSDSEVSTSSFWQPSYYDKAQLNAKELIKTSNSYLSAINNSNIENDDLLNIANSISEFRELSTTEKLNAINFDLNIKRNIFRENDISIQELIRKKKILLLDLQVQMIGTLNAKIEYARNELLSVQRPQPVLLKFRDLLNSINKSNLNINELEKQYNALSLENARREDPWQLITNPTLLPYPVAPSRTKVAVIGLVSGFFVGLLSSLIYEKKEDIIYSSNELNLLSDIPLISELTIDKQEFLQKEILLLLNGPFSSLVGTIGILTLSNVDDNKIQLILDNFNKIRPDLNILVSNNIQELIDISNLFILVDLNYTNRSEFNRMINTLGIQKKVVFGTIVLKSKKAGKLDYIFDMFLNFLNKLTNLTT